jgi:hypothetical protein
LNQFRDDWNFADVKEECRQDAKNKFTGILDRGHVNKNDLNKFLSNNGMTLLQEAVTINGALCFTKALLQAGANPNSYGENTLPSAQCAPALLAVQKAGRVGISWEPFELRDTLKLLLLHGADFTVNDSNQNTILHILLKKESWDVGKEVWSFVVDLYGEHMKTNEVEDSKLRTMLQKIVNKRNMDKKAPLSIAIELDWLEVMDGDVIKLLLSLGAYVGMEKVPSSFMDYFLNECLIPESHPGPTKTAPEIDSDFFAIDPGALPSIYKATSITHPEMNNDQIIKFDYSFLVSPSEDDDCAPEMQWVSEMAQSKEHRHLLRHPVIKSYLHIKWTLVRRNFNLNLFMYVQFTFVLTWFLFEEFGLAQTEHKPDIWNLLHGILTVVTSILMMMNYSFPACKVLGTGKCNYKLRTEKIPLLAMMIVIGSAVAISACGTPFIPIRIMLFLLLLRELLQFVHSPLVYIRAYENYMELITFVLLGIILFNQSMEQETKKVLGAYALVIAWSEMLVHTGKHPLFTQLNKIRFMFVGVVKSYSFLLIWYILIIIAFAFGFHIIMHKDITPSDTKRTNSTNSTHDVNFFQYPLLSVVKTITMMIGELNVSDLPLPKGKAPLTLAFLFLCVFIFLIIIVLINLSSALAVQVVLGDAECDTAETFSFLTRVETISLVDNDKSFMFRRNRWAMSLWNYITNIKGTRIMDHPDKFPIWSVRIKCRYIISH